MMNNIPNIFLKSLAAGATTFFLAFLTISWLWSVAVDKPIAEESIRRDQVAVKVLLEDQMVSALYSGDCSKLATDLVKGLPGVRLSIYSDTKPVCTSHPLATGWVSDESYLPIRIGDAGSAILHHVAIPGIYKKIKRDLRVGFTISPPETYETWRANFITAVSLAIATFIFILLLISQVKSQRLRQLKHKLLINEDDLASLYEQKELEVNRPSSMQKKVEELEIALSSRNDKFQKLRDELADSILSGHEGESLDDIVREIIYSLKHSKIEIAKNEKELFDAYEGWEMETDSDNQKIDGLQGEINALEEKVKSLQEEQLDVINKQQLKDQVQQGTRRLERVQKLWINDKLTWKERKAIEKEISPNALPFSAFLAMISIERHLRKMSGVGDDSHARKSVFINSVIIERNQRERVWNIFNARDKWFHGEKSPGSVRQYERIINLAKEIDAKVVSV